MHGIDSFGKKTLWRFLNCKDFHCECPRTKASGKTKMFLHPGNEQDFWGYVLHYLLIWLWMRQEWAYPFYRFPKGSGALWHICRHIIGRLTIWDYICQVSARCPAWKLVRKTQLLVFFHGTQTKAFFHERHMNEEICDKTPWGLIQTTFAMFRSILWS